MYSMRKKVNGRYFRYNSSKQVLEHVEKDIAGKWVVMDFMDLSPDFWKNRKTRKMAFRVFDESISDFEFGQKFNVDLSWSA